MSKKKKEKKLKIEILKEEKKDYGINYYLSFAIFFIISYFTIKTYLSKFPFNLEMFIEMLNPFEYFSANVFKNITWISIEIFKITIFTLSAMGFGKKTLKLSSLNDENNNIFILSYITGISIITFFAMLTGFIGFINKMLYLSFSSLGFLLFLWDFYKSGWKLEFNIKEEFKNNKFYSFILILIICFNLIQSLAPEIFYDTLVYHLGIPNYWLINGKISEVPYNIYSKLSLNHSVLYLFSLTAFGIQNTQLTNFITSIFCFFSIIFLFKKYFFKNTTFIAGIIFYSIFHVAQSIQSATSDIIAAIFVIAGFYSVIKAIEENNTIWIFFAGIFSGFAFGTKYNTAFIIIATLGVFLYSSLKEQKIGVKRTIWIFFLFSIGFLIFTMPWFIKNYINHSNPLFPFGYKILNKEISSIDIEKIEGLMNEIRQFSKLDFGMWIKLPFLISTGQIINSEFFTPIFIMVLPLAVFVYSKHTMVKRLWFVFIFSWIFWSVSSTTIRHLFSVYFIISILTAYYINEAFDGWFKTIIKLTTFVTVIFSINWIAYQIKVEERYKVVFGDLNRDEYLSISHPRYPNPSYSIIKYINEKLPMNSKILFVAEPKSFYVNRKFESSSVFDRNPLVDITIDSKNVEEIYNRFKKMGFSHILINIAETIRISKGYRLFYWKESDLKKFNEFFDKHLEIEKEHERIVQDKIAEKTVLYKIVEKKSKSEPNYLFQALSIIGLT